MDQGTVFFFPIKIFIVLLTFIVCKCKPLIFFFFLKNNCIGRDKAWWEYIAAKEFLSQFLELASTDKRGHIAFHSH